MPAQKMGAVMNAPRGARFHFGGLVGDRITVNEENWVLRAPAANPGLLQIFRDRDRKPRQHLVPWAGEYAGKYLTSAVGCYRLTQDKRLYRLLKQFVRDLIGVQDEDGYLGVHPKGERLTGNRFGCFEPLWDVWGHYHSMLGLLLWWQESRDSPALEACVKAADLICRTFLDANMPLSVSRSPENNGVIHIFTLLYLQTQETRYLEMADKITKDWEAPKGVDFVRAAAAGRELYEFPWPRWEALHSLQGIVELLFITGEKRYLKAVTHIWQSIRGYDRHNTGAFSSNEQAVGSPYDERAIETCCVIAWIAFSIDVLRATGDSTVADEIELSTFNAVLAAHHPSGRWFTYNTPMDGVRRASFLEIGGAAPLGGSELNCCSVNGPRGIGMLSEWAFMLAEDGVTINFYGPCTVELPLTGGPLLNMTQVTDYPRGGRVDIELALEKPRRMALRFRIPSWSRNTVVSVNGCDIKDVKAGSYLPVTRMWKNGDSITLEFDMSLHFWTGEREKANLVSAYRGPILLAYDQRFNSMDPDDVPLLDPGNLSYTMESWSNEPAPWVLLGLRAADGRELRLCDFATAGAAGTHYRSWLGVSGVETMPAEMQSPFASRLGTVKSETKP